MPLAAGQTLSHYQLLSPLGTGGMGEVWRARDSKLGREVAVKVLPEEFAADQDRRRRFEREARSLAALNHPCIAHVYGIDREADTHFIVMELVPGEDLATRIARAPLPPSEAIALACQIASGLEAAHGAGIVHRDLKPANVRITPDERIKVLDFGLAKLAPGASGRAGDGSDSPRTEEGRVLGTPAYMSPEHLRGKAVDQRTDAWALGCVLYECLTGRRPFDGESLSEVVAAVLEREPDFDVLPATAPAALRRVLERCLRKDESRRLRDMGDIRLLLEDCTAAASQGGATPVVAPAKHRLAGALMAITGLAFGAVLWMLWPSEGSSATDERPGPERWSLQLEPEEALGWRGTSSNLSKLGGGSPLIAIASRARRVAYCVDRGDGSEIRVRDLGRDFEDRSVSGSEDARAPFFEPGGEWLGFFAGQWLQVVKVDGGGSPQKVHSLSSPNFAACWTEDGWILFACNSGLWRVRPNGSELESLAAPDLALGEAEFSSPSVSPEASSVLFTVSTGTGSHVSRLDLTTGDREVVVAEGSNARALPRGRILYAHAGGLRVLDAARIGEPVPRVSEPVLSGLYTTPSPGGLVLTHYALSDDGTLVYAPAVEQATRSSVHWVEPGGSSQLVVDAQGFLEHPRLAPDGASFACDILDERGLKDVFLYDFARGGLRAVTADGTSIMSAWSPRGELTVRSATRQNRLRNLSVLGQPAGELATIAGDDHGTALIGDCWSSDGELLLLTRKASEGRSLWTLIRGEARPVKLLGPEREPRFGSLSPDGAYLAFTATVRGENQVFVCPFPALVPELQLSLEGGAEPLWSQDGRTVYFRRARALLSCTLETEPTLAPGELREVLPADSPYDWEPGGHTHYDLDPAGPRFLMVEQRRSAPRRLQVVTDWIAELPGQP